LLGLPNSVNFRIPSPQGRPHLSLVARPQHPLARELASLAPFADVPATSLESLAQLGDIVDLPAGYVLMHAGRYGHEAFLLVDGEVEVIADDEVVARSHAGDVVGELALLDPRATRNATVVTSAPTRAIVLDPRAYRSLRDLPGLDRLLVRQDRYTSAA
jgi:CRP-like cAMP-binding protein